MNSLRYIYQCLKCYRIVPTIRYYKYYLLSAVIISISFIVVIMFSYQKQSFIVFKTTCFLFIKLQSLLLWQSTRPTKIDFVLIWKVMMNRNVGFELIEVHYSNFLNLGHHLLTLNISKHIATFSKGPMQPLAYHSL